MNLRPAAVIKANWQEIIVIEENATWLEPVYFKEVHADD